MSWSFLIIKGQLQHVAISSTRLRSVLTIKDQLQHVTISSDNHEAPGFLHWFELGSIMFFILSNYILHRPHRWCNGHCALVVCGRSCFGVPFGQTKEYELDIC
jgi:hypothetical protein